MSINISKPKRSRKRLYPRKTQLVLQAAEQAFIKGGYGGASVDAIAELAGVSKRTVYNNFANKEALFAEVIKSRCNEVVPEPVDEKRIHEDPETGLIAIASAFLQALYTPEQIALYQTIVSDSRQFPEVGRIMYEGPIMRSNSVFDFYLRQQVALGRMDFPDIDLAAPQLVALLKTNVHMQLLFNQRADTSHKTIAKIAKASVRLFLYGASVGTAPDRADPVNKRSLRAPKPRAARPARGKK